MTTENTGEFAVSVLMFNHGYKSDWNYFYEFFHHDRRLQETYFPHFLCGVSFSFM